MTDTPYNRRYNFSAGPACLPLPVLEQAQRDLICLPECGASVLEISHRSATFKGILASARTRLRRLLGISDEYDVFFMQGGSRLQFSMVPMNLLPENGYADYIDTGSWSAKAIVECKRVGGVNIIGSSKDSLYSYIPKDLIQSGKSSYLHITSNNTIYGTQFKEYPLVNNDKCFLVADMSSDILSKPIDVSKFGLIYAGAQKNMGPAGVTLVIIRSDLVEINHRDIPTMMKYSTHVSKDSMFNTPPVFSVCVVNETLKWIKSIGGLHQMKTINESKASLLYDEIDRNTLFKSPVNVEDRSTMNVPFIFYDNDLKDEEFLKFCEKRNLRTLKGHRSVGGFRASIYNAMPEAGVEALIAAMQEYEHINS